MRNKGRFKVLTTAVMTAVLVFSLAIGTGAATGTKSLSAIFRNIRIVANGSLVQAEEEPFIVNGRTYVPLRVVSEALGAWVDWNQATSMVTIKSGSTAEVANLKAQIAQKDALIAQLQAKLKDQGTGNLKDLQRSLNKDYDELEDVEIDEIRLSGTKDRVTVNIDVDLDDFGREWKTLSDRDIKSWVSDIIGDVQDFYDDDTYVSGKIKDIDSGDSLVTFNKDGGRTTSISYKDDDYRGSGGELTVYEVERSLTGKRFSIDTIDFKVDYIRYSTSTDDVTVRLIALEEDARRIDDDDLGTGAKKIGKAIADKFSDDAGANLDMVKLELYDIDRYSVGDYDYDVDRDRLI